MNTIQQSFAVVGLSGVLFLASALALDNSVFVVVGLIGMVCGMTGYHLSGDDTVR